ncbi:MAG: tripartite tricarboxylate transporter substrate binding protein [Betaproteobacteria bacterium]|nr:MAG: tripartite tricarboxylate transporter substrate binding protein [Betaproteobacteria bacterium]TMH76642.1 MAG: tripartite tricarboxylate transporter substrate binding protein [Betaproteobacteria bacterium]
MRSRLAARLACLAAASSMAATAHAQQDFPNKPVHIIVGYAAGGGNDIIVRVVAPKMSEGLGQPVIIENKPGAQGIISCEYVAKSAPDGYTLLMGPSGPMTMNPAIYSKLPYAPLKDFAPISMIGDFPLILVVSASLPANSVKELIAYAKARPDKVNYAASAAPFQLAAELFNQKTGTKFVHIPYKSSGESVGAVMSGQVTMTIMDPPPAIGPLKGGKVRGLAVTSASRDPSMPDVPTLTEAGVPDVEIRLFTGFLAPAATPSAIVKRLQQELARVVKLPEIKERLDQMAIVPSGNTPEEFRGIIARDIAKWTAVAKAANIKAD